ncbi:MAG: transglutaminase family protein [Cyanobium sp. PLM2.Bin73]|nr:MAG: transglutaminase family protein [Cyanobium sp. PLM2.Bin73]
MRLHAGCKLLFEATGPSSLILMLRPRSGPGQRVVREANEYAPDTVAADFIDSNGNLCQRLMINQGSFQIESTVTVETSDFIDTAPGSAFVPVHELPDFVLPFLLPSRYCQSDLVGELAQTMIEGQEHGYDQVEAIRSWIHAHIEYRYGTSSASTSAVDTVHSRVGVCRDFVHLGIALCRSLSIPARMVVGYLHKLEPMDLHAWFEAFVGGRWYTFDATQAQPRGNRIAIAYGRDAADVALANQFGPIDLTGMEVWVHAAQS